VQLVRWSQSSFPAILPGGVTDSHPLMQPLIIPVPADIAAHEAAVAGRWTEGTFDDLDPDDLATH
jgi:nitrous oxidase accessory protein